MEDALLDILAALRCGTAVDAAWLDKLVRRHNRAAHDGTRQVAKRRLLPYYLAVKAQEPQRWAGWGVTDAEDAALIRLLQAKPRRTASGVATITVLTKPWPCSSNCVYCPSDIRMPKSYLSDEPACQRAERCWFDPFLQVSARLGALTAMGHVTDKVELIVLGGTWSDYPLSYQRWFIGELFRALNLTDSERVAEAEVRRRFYENLGLPREREALAREHCALQRRIDEGVLTYNEAWHEAYGSGPHRLIAALIEGDGEQGAETTANVNGAPRPYPPSAIDDVHRANEHAAKRVVGLVVETRPDLITIDSCRHLRNLGCTKVQIGIQSLDDGRLARNGRAITAERVAEALGLLRLFGFKSHVHFMANLLGATPAEDIADYERLVTGRAFLPDEVKLYPCCLVASSALTDHLADGTWHPYTEDDLIAVLSADVAATPPWTRISRMIRDISATDILVGNKKTNLRQLVEAHLDGQGVAVQEIRQREISVEGAPVANLTLRTIPYDTTVSEERFLQWVTPAGRIAGFLRLSLPKERAIARLRSATPPAVSPCSGDALACDGLPALGEAMIREVHVYGKVAALHATGEGAQPLGLGRKLVEEACAQAAQAGCDALNVISAVGTRDYYRRLGFVDSGLYQKRPLP